jgi:O-methyltransferase domain
VTVTTSSPANIRTIAKRVLGVPSVPPGFVTDGVNRVRAALGRVHAAMAPPPVRILEGLFGILDHRVLVALCAADVPDALIEPMTATALARRVDADPAQLERLLRYAVTRGWVRFDGAGRVAPTRVTEFLRADHAGGWRAWVDFAGGADVTGAVAELSATAHDAFAAANGRPFFEWLREHPDRAGAFDGAMAAGGRMHGLTLAAALDWSDRARVCDVGGGTGDLLATLLDLVPHLEGAVFDLPHVIARAVTRPRLQAIAGDAFVAVPPGFDTYLLVNVLHDWNDADAARILSRVADAARPTGATVIVVDSDARTVPRADLSISADILMAALTDGGVERDTAAFGALGATCGLRRVRTTRLASGDLAHAFLPAGPVPPRRVERCVRFCHAPRD